MAHICNHYWANGICVHCHGATVPEPFRGSKLDDDPILRVGSSARAYSLTNAMYAESRYVRPPFSQWAFDNAERTLRLVKERGR